MQLDCKFGRTAYMEGREYLFFSGYDYLAMQSCREFTQLVKDGIEKYGWLFASARITNTQIPIYEKAEKNLCNLTGSEDAVLFSSGFAAGQAVTSLFRSGLFNAGHSHPAILQEKNQYADSNSWLREITSGQNKIAYAEDSVDNLGCQLQDFSFLKKVSAPATIIIDDSHGIGITGQNGNGVSGYIPINTIVDYIYTFSMGKAFGVTAGAVCCPHSIAEKLRKHPAYAAATPPNPGLLYAFVKAQDIYLQALEKLKENISLIQKLLGDIPAIKTNKALPFVILPSFLKEAEFLKEGVIISSFAYPDPEGNKLNRLVLNAAHRKEDIEKIATITRRQLAKTAD